MALHVMDQLVRFGEVRRGTLGVYVQDLTADLAGAFGLEKGRGVLVAEVAADSAADKAGLQAGDVVTSIAGNTVRSAQEFHNIEGQFPVGESLEIEYLRDQATERTTINVEQVQALEGGRVDPRLAGATFEELPFKDRSDGVGGVLISSLEPRSRLARQGLREGDIIMGSNRTRIRDLKEMQEVIPSLRGTLYLQIRRDGGDYIARID
jgi:S1-C subfamily serine protease